MPQEMPNKPVLRLGKVYSSDTPGQFTKIWHFPFTNEQGLLIFTMNAIADTEVNAADEIRNLLNAMMVEISLDYPKMITGDDGWKCGYCSFVGETEDIMKSHIKVMH